MILSPLPTLRQKNGHRRNLSGLRQPYVTSHAVNEINVSQRALHIYWQPSAMSHAIHKIVSKRRCQSYFISRRSPHHGISKDSDLCASAHRCLHYAYARLIARVTFNLYSKGVKKKYLTPMTFYSMIAKVHIA